MGGNVRPTVLCSQQRDPGVRKTNLKRTKRGYVRNLGRLPNGGQPKFYLGHDREEAVRRLDRIAELWRVVEEEHENRRSKLEPPQPAVWDRHSLEAAKALAQGETPKIA